MRATITGVKIAGITSVVPSRSISALQTGAAMGLSEDESLKIANVTGIKHRRIAPAGMCTSDMGVQAANLLLEPLSWERSSIDVLIVVSQSLDYRYPATACLLQDRLGLSDQCAAFDVPLGCSGYVYGLWLLASLLSSGSGKRGLLIAGETGSTFYSPVDRSTAFLLGDCATATALERDEAAKPMYFVMGTDGSGKNFLIQSGGGSRNPVTEESTKRVAGEDGYVRNQLELYMNGAEVFSFTIKRVPKLFRDTLQLAGWDMFNVDAFVPHQANLFMLNHLAKSMKVPHEKMLLSLEEFGNTSSASIPVTVNHRLHSKLNNSRMNLILAGFGVGWSWGAAGVTCGPMIVPPVCEIADEPAANAGSS